LSFSYQLHIGNCGLHRKIGGRIAFLSVGIDGTGRLRLPPLAQLETRSERGEMEEAKGASPLEGELGNNENL
jgi:hypothetical protein